jgi:hypothetical protein
MNVKNPPAPDVSGEVASLIDFQIKSRLWVQTELMNHYEEPTIFPLDYEYMLPADMDTAIQGAKWHSESLPDSYRQRGQDCDDFAIGLWQQFSAGRSSIGVGVVSTSTHAWNVLVAPDEDGENTVQDWEPQPVAEPEIEAQTEPYSREDVFIMI